jgi:hypothetical protein
MGPEASVAWLLHTYIARDILEKAKGGLLSEFRERKRMKERKAISSNSHARKSKWNFSRCLLFQTNVISRPPV